MLEAIEGNRQLTPDQIVDSWSGCFSYKKQTGNSSGLRSPQIGALHAIMAHIEEESHSGIVVMPTGTGKTETMLSFMVANQCHKVFVVVPSDSLRSQTVRKFKTLGLLPKLGIVPPDINLPIVKKVFRQLDDREWQDVISNSNVIVTTMSLAADINSKVRGYLREQIDFLFVDEAHHSKAGTWENFINIFPPKRVLLFTATPFRNDGQKLKGKVIFNFSLKKSQEQGYYQPINYYPILMYSQADADKAIAEKTVEILRNDLKDGYDHIAMARCNSKKRAEEVFKYYEQYQDLSPVVIYSGKRNSVKILKEIIEKKHRIIVCVNMLGEGYDLPQLKIAAIHDERQSLAVTLQFIGRFTRTNVSNLGKASFITNIAYPPIAKEINCLYQNDADWNCILPRLNEEAATKQQKLSEFLATFKGDLNEEISLEDIRPALSAEIFTVNSTTTSFSNWKKAISNASRYDYMLHSLSADTLVVVLGKSSPVLWGDMKNIHDLDWGIIVVYFDAYHKRIYLNSSIDLQGQSFLQKLFPAAEITKIAGEAVYRVFSNINRIRLFNVGARLPQGKDISFQSYFGSSVQDGLDLLSQHKLLKNNLFGLGFKNGEKTSVGCSNKGRIWSRERADLLHFKKWCDEIGKIVSDESIDTNVILTNTLKEEKLKAFPSECPIGIDWNPEIYEHYTLCINLAGSYLPFDEFDMSIESETSVGRNIVFSLQSEEQVVKIAIAINCSTQNMVYIPMSADTQICFCIGSMEYSISEFFAEFPPTIYYSDNAISYGMRYCKPKTQAPLIDESLISSLSWENVNLRHESQGAKPYVADSIQYYMAERIKEDYAFLIDDDGSGEIADLIGINNNSNTIDITMYHLKYALNGRVSNDINNLYQVCGQAQKSVRWKYLRGSKIFDHICKRNEQKVKKGKSSSILKGSIADMLKLREEASNLKEVKYHVVIVQPGMSKSSCSNEIKLLLGCTVQYLHETANIDCQVICSN